MPQIAAQTLEFQISVAMRPVEYWQSELPKGVPQEGACLTVIPLVDGEPLLYTDVFDVSHIWTSWRNKLSGPFDILTCSCGVAGCAGFFESAQIRLNKKTVQWYLPPDYQIGESFGIANLPREDSEHADTRKWTLVEFPRKVYDQAMTLFEAKFNEIRAEQNGFLWIAPNYPEVRGPEDGEKGTPDLKAQALAQRRYRNKRNKEEQETLDHFGDLAWGQIHIEEASENLELVAYTDDILRQLYHIDFLKKNPEAPKDDWWVDQEGEAVKEFRIQEKWDMAKMLQSMPQLLELPGLRINRWRGPEWVEKALDDEHQEGAEYKRLQALLKNASFRAQPWVEEQWVEPAI